MPEIHTTTLSCGLVVVIEPLASMQSLALRWHLPVGSATDPEANEGYSTLVSELVFRGAGELDARQHSDALDRLGVQRSSSTLTHHLRLDATMLARHLDAALPLFTSMVRSPIFAPGALDPVRSLCLQSLEGLADDPQHLVMLRLREHHRPPPLNRTGYGRAEALNAATVDDLRTYWSSRARPGGSILGVAGQVDPSALCHRLEELLQSWTGVADDVAATAAPTRGRHSINQASSQVHIGLALDAPAERHEDSVLERLAIGVLSGSSSGRLFTEVRQKRSLCYSVGASYRSGRDDGLVTLYAGTTPERAQETLDVSVGEIHRLREGATADEFARVVTGIKSQLVMSGESTSARAAGVALDYYRLGRARTLEEIAARIEAVTLDELNAYLARREFGPFTIVSIGPVDLNDPPAPA